MLSSMTGFGSAQGQVEGIEYAVEVRSANSRYVKFSIKLPEGLTSTEPDIEALLRSRIVRGSVALSVRVKVPDDQAAYRLNTAALASYLRQIRPLEAQADPMLRIDIGSLLQLPGVCEPPPLEEVFSRSREGMMTLAEQALEGLIRMRRAEGARLRDELLGLAEAVASSLSEIALRAPRVVAGYQERLAARVEELTAAGNIQIDSEQLAREVAIFAERCDITEELTRLKSHLEQFRSAVEVDEPAGRKLDFIAQEMLREANTIASKANDEEISRLTVDLKTTIDRIKEQVQNVE